MDKEYGETQRQPFMDMDKTDETYKTDEADIETAGTPAAQGQCSGCPDCCRTKQRSPQEYRALQNRLSRIEGQVRGVRKMLESNAYCPDILTQVSAVNAALNSFSRELLSQHIRTCVRDDLLAGREETVDELLATLQRLMK